MYVVLHTSSHVMYVAYTQIRVNTYVNTCPSILITSSSASAHHRPPLAACNTLAHKIHNTIHVNTGKRIRKYMCEECYIDLASVLRRSGRVVSITHVGRYHVVPIQPPDRRGDVVHRLRNVNTATRSVSDQGRLRSVISISPPYLSLIHI